MCRVDKVGAEWLGLVNPNLAVDVLENHVKIVAEDLGVKLDWFNALHGMMFVEEEPMRVEIPILTGFSGAELEKRYLVCLHELGHCFHGHTQGRPPFQGKRFYFENGVLRSEAEAWNWALDNMLLEEQELSLEARRFMWKDCLGSYLVGYIQARGKASQLWNGNRHYVTFTYDEPGDYFFRVQRRLEGAADGNKNQRIPLSHDLQGV